MIRAFVVSSMLVCDALLSQSHSQSQVQSPSLSPQLDQTLADIRVKNRTEVGNADTHRRAIIGRRIFEREAYIQLDPELRNNPVAAERERREGLALGQQEAHLRPWVGSSAELWLNGGVVFGSHYLEKLPRYGKPAAKLNMVVTPWVGKKVFEYLDEKNLEEIGRANPADQVVFYNDLIDYNLVMNPEFKRVYGHGVAIGVHAKPIEQHPQVVASRSYGAKVRAGDDLTTTFRQIKKDHPNGRVALNTMVAVAQRQGSNYKLSDSAYEMLQTEANENVPKIIDEVGAIIEDSRASNEQRRLRTQRIQGNVVGTMHGMANLSRLANQPGPAQFFSSVAGLTDAAFKFSRLTDTLAQNPMAYVNFYLFAATSVVSIIKDLQGGQSPEQQAFEAQRKAFAHISGQISQMREEMHSEFQKLNLRLDHYFYETKVDLNDIQGSLRSLGDAMTVIGRDIQSLSQQMREAHDQVGRIQQLHLNLECFITDGRGRAIPVISDITANKCIGGYLSMAHGAYSALTPGNLTVLERDHLRSLVAAVNKHTRGAVVDLAVEPHFIFGASELGRWVDQNPNYTSLTQTKEALDLNHQYNLKSTIATGEQIQSFYRTMSLVPTDKGLRIRRSVFDAAFDDLVATAEAVADKADETRRTVLTDYPDLALGWTNGSPASTPKSGTLIVPEMEYCFDDEKDYDVSYAGFGVQGIDQRIHSASEAKIKPEFLTYFPDSAKWADRIRGAGFGNLRLKACFNKMQFKHDGSRAGYSSHFGLRGSVGLEAKYEIIFYALYNDDQSRGLISRRLARYEAKASQSVEPFATPAKPLPLVAWSGELFAIKFPERQIQIMKGDNGYGIANNHRAWFTRLPDTERITRDRREFEGKLQNHLDGLKPHLMREVHRAAEAETRALSLVIWRIITLIERGLDMNNPVIAHFHADFIRDVLGSSDEFVRQVVEKSPKVAVAQIKERVERFKEKFEDVERCAVLRPARQAITPAIDTLKSIERRPQPGFFERLMNR